MSIEKWDAWSAVYQRREHRYIAEGNGWFFSITPSDFIRRWNVNVLCYFPTQNLFSDAESNICKHNTVIINDITLFWRDKSYAEGRLRDRKLARICKWSCRPKKKKQTSENMAMRFFANSHLLTRIFAHSCIRCEASAFVLQSLSLQIAFSCSFLFSSLQMFIL